MAYAHSFREMDWEWSVSMYRKASRRFLNLSLILNETRLSSFRTRCSSAALSCQRGSYGRAGSPWAFAMT